VISFQWALTHRAFSRILPDSSNFSRVILKFFSKCDVRMISISHMPSPRSLSNSFSSLVQPFNSSFRSAQQFLWHFSSSFSTFGDRRSVSLNLGPFSWWVVVLASCHPHYRFDCEEPFYAIRSISRILFFVFLRRPSFQKISSFSVFNFVLQLFFIDVSSFVSIFLRWFIQDYPSVVIILIHLFFS